MDVFAVETKRGKRHPTQRPRRRSRFAYLVVCALVLLACSLVALFFNFLKQRDQKEEAEPVQSYKYSIKEPLTDLPTACAEELCLSKECVTTASRILSYMDDSVNPCSDFYTYACGSYRKYKFVRSGEQTYDVRNEAIDNIVVSIKRLFDDREKTANSQSFHNAKVLFETCMNTTKRNENATDLLRNFLSEYEIYWPLLEDDTESDVSWTHPVSAMEKYGFHTLFKPSFTVEEGHTSIKVDCNIPLLPADVYLNPNEGMHEIKLKFYRNVILLLADLFEVKRKEAKKIYEGILDLETEMTHALIVGEEVSGDCSTPCSKAWCPPCKSRTAAERYPLSESHEQQLKEIWAPLLGRPFSEIEVKSVCHGNLEGAMQVLDSASKKSVLNYVGLRALLHLLQYLGSRHQSLYNHYANRLIVTPVVPQSAWRQCSELLRREMGQATAKALFNWNYFHFDQINEIMKRFTDMKQAFGHVFQMIPWMNNQTAETFMQKLNKMTLQVGYPTTFSDGWVEELYNGLSLEKNGSFFDNIMKLHAFKTNQRFYSLVNKHDGTQYDSFYLDHSPLGTDATYSYVKNRVDVDFGLLVSPILKYGPGLPKYLEYGQDVILAREISRAFDTTGIMYDGSGNHVGVDVLPELVKQKFYTFVTCLAQQYHTFFGSHADPEALDSEIADLGAFYLTYAGLNVHLKSHDDDDERGLPGISMTKQQIYLLQAAQMFCEVRDDPYIDFRIEHKPQQKPRVNSAVANMVGIAPFFKCSSGTPMNPTEKCNLLI